ncbi:hypothetical protein N9L40_01270, partial [Rhodobacteraceae bacterium]|nr:hypothetical protein [Paracoccaceae bacterium]
HESEILCYQLLLFVTNCFSLDYYNTFRNLAPDFSSGDYKKFKNNIHIGTFDYFREIITNIEKYCDICSLEEILT